MTMNQLLTALSLKLSEIAENTVDMDTASELNELIEKIVESIK